MFIQIDWEQSSPVNPFSHWHVPSFLQKPLKLHSFLQDLNWQEGPVKPESQKQIEFLHKPKDKIIKLPLRLQFFGQAFSEQSSPVKPALQTQLPFIQSPFLLQLFGHSLILQLNPVHPWLHWHFPKIKNLKRTFFFITNTFGRICTVIRAIFILTVFSKKSRANN